MRTTQIETDEVALRAFLSTGFNLKAIDWSSWAADGNVTLTWVNDGSDLTVAELTAPQDHPVWTAGVL